jgi:hypothetical protein
MTDNTLKSTLQKSATSGNWTYQLILVGFLLFSLVACSSGTSSTTVPPPATATAAKQSYPTQTPLPAGTVLYQANLSHGLAGLQGSQGWKAQQGQLESDPSGSATFTIPYQPTASNYAVEVRIQIVRSVPPNGGYFSIFAPKTPGKDGYQAGISGLKGSAPRPFGDHPQSQVFIVPNGDMTLGSGLPQDHEPGTAWHTYRVEVHGNEASLLADGVQIGDASSQQTDFLSNGPIGFKCQLVILHVSNISILTL